MALPSPPKPEFEPDGIPAGSGGSYDEAQAPALSSTRALARFEFESGRGNEGTKILMIEWEDESENSADWKIEWSSKTTVLSAKDGADGSLHRIYFLLAPGASIPPIVKLSQGDKTIQTNPLPAIFPPELGISATTAGKKGVLHTVWSKQRLSVLQKEIEAEMKKNGEGVGLEMALQEKQWIEENFGVSAKAIPDAQLPASPTSPRSPGNGKLSEKLKGLKLGTSASVLNAPAAVLENPQNNGSAHPLSPNLGDVAVSSFAAFHGGSSRPPRAVAQIPPANLVSMQNESRQGSRINSLDAVAGGNIPENEDPEIEDGLFAVKMSPRSPEMTKSPFSFAATETAPWKE